MAVAYPKMERSIGFHYYTALFNIVKLYVGSNPGLSVLNVLELFDSENLVSAGNEA